MKIYSYYIKYLIIFLLLLSNCIENKNNTSNHDKKYTIDELKEDFNYLRYSLEKNHPALYLYNTKIEFDSLFEASYSQINKEMNKLEFFRLLAPVVANVRCSHTFFCNPYTSEYWNYIRATGKYLPLGLYFYDGKSYISHNYSNIDSLILESEIVSINNRSIRNIQNILLESLPSDGFNQTHKYKLINSAFHMLYSNFIENPNQFQITYILPNSNYTKSLILLPLDYNKIKAKVAEQKNKEKNRSNSIEFDKDKSTAILTIISFAKEQQNFKNFINDAFTKIKNKNINNLIIDLRGNGGGSSEFSAYLLTYLLDREFIYFADDFSYVTKKRRSEPNWLYKAIEPNQSYFNGNIFVLIDGWCCSATGHFCSLLKYYKRAIFIGEETCGSFYCNDNASEFELPNTKFIITIARTTFETAVSGIKKGHGISPIYEIKQSVMDKINKNDREMSFALTLIDKIL